MSSSRAAILQFAAPLFLILVMTACAGITSNPAQPTQQKQTVTIAVSPTSATLMVSKNQQFKAAVRGTNNTAVTWAVDGTAGGNAAVGLISSAGL